MRLTGILFDKDGTLVDFDATWGVAADVVMRQMSGAVPETFAALAKAMHFVAAERRFLPTSPMIAGSSADYGHIWAQVLGRVPEPAFLAEMDRAFESEGLAALTPIGMPETIMARLRAGGLRLGLATNDAQASARSQLRQLGLFDHFEFIAGYDSGFGIKPHPGMVTAFARQIGAECGAVALVGDSVHDLMAARAAGAHAIAVLSGPADEAELAVHADHVLASIADLPDLLERYFEFSAPLAGAAAPPAC